jgi:hypothetical protein
MGASEIDLVFHRRPGALANIALAALGISAGFKMGNNTSRIRAIWEDVEVNPTHLKAFGDICGLPSQTEYLHPLYPLTLGFPLIMRILGHKKAPLTPFRTLNTRLLVNSHRRIGTNERLSLTCETGAVRIVARGLEIDLSTVAQIGADTVWESLHTFFYRGNFGEPQSPNSHSTELSARSDCDLWSSWRLPNGIGWRFARISGDGNGIHYSSWYARAFGFERAFAQPILILTRSLHALPNFDLPRFRLDTLLKGPVYYGSAVYIKGMTRKTGIRFDIHSGRNPRPSICCELTC